MLPQECDVPEWVANSDCKGMRNPLEPHIHYAFQLHYPRVPHMFRQRLAALQLLVRQIRPEAAIVWSGHTGT